MNEVTVPFWIVKQWRGLLSLPVELGGMQGFIAVFATVEGAAEFMWPVAPRSPMHVEP